MFRKGGRGLPARTAAAMVLFRGGWFSEESECADDVLRRDGDECTLEMVPAQRWGRELGDTDRRLSERSMSDGLPAKITETTLAVTSWLRRLGAWPSSLPDS